MDLYISDLDGTLLNSKGELNQYTINQMNDLIAKGLKFTVATARGIDSVKKIIEPLNIDLPIVLNNGLFIYDLKNDQVIKSHCIEKKIAEEIYNVLIDYDAEPMLRVRKQNEDIVYYDSCQNEFIQAFIENKKDAKDISLVQSKCIDFKNIKIHSIFTLGSEKKLKDASRFLNSKYDLGIDFYQDTYNDAYWLEINPLRATKGEAALSLKEKFKLNEIISFGDNLNDLSMFHISQKSHGMTNGNNKIKPYVTKIIGTNDENSVAKEIWRLFLEERNQYKEIC